MKINKILQKNGEIIYTDSPKTKEEWENTLRTIFEVSVNISLDEESFGEKVVLGYSYYKVSQLIYKSVIIKIDLEKEIFKEWLDKNREEILKGLSVYK